MIFAYSDVFSMDLDPDDIEISKLNEGYTRLGIAKGQEAQLLKDMSIDALLSAPNNLDDPSIDYIEEYVPPCDINAILEENCLSPENLDNINNLMYLNTLLLIPELRAHSKVYLNPQNKTSPGFFISEISVRKDGNCGYTALGVLRSDVFNRLCDFLTPNSENYNAEVKDYITSEIAMQCAYWSIMKPYPKEELQLLAWFYETPFSDLKNSEDVNFQLSKLTAQNLEDIQKRLEREDETYDFFYQKLSQIEDPEVYETVVLPFLKYTVFNKSFDGSNRDTPPFWLQIGFYDKKSLADVIAKYILKKKIVLISIQNDSGSVVKILGGEIDQNDPPESIGWIINENNIHYTRGILNFQNPEDTHECLHAPNDVNVENREDTHNVAKNEDEALSDKSCAEAKNCESDSSKPKKRPRSTNQKSTKNLYIRNQRTSKKRK